MQEIFDSKIDELKRVFRISFVPNIDKSVIRFVNRIYNFFALNFNPQSSQNIPSLMTNMFKEIKMEGKVYTQKEIYNLWKITVVLSPNLEDAKNIVLSDLKERLVHPLINQAFSYQKDIDLFFVFHVYQDYIVLKSLFADFFPPESLCNKYQDSLMGNVLRHLDRRIKDIPEEKIKEIGDSIPHPLEDSDPRRLFKRKVEKIINNARKNETYSAFLDACLNNPVWPELKFYLQD